MTDVTVPALGNALPLPGARKPPLIDHEAVQLDLCGHHRRIWFVRLPEGFIAADLSETGVWLNVQRNPMKALRPHDQLYLIAFDESWIADAIVTDATVSGASLTRPHLVKFESRVKPLFNDGVYRVAWHGRGYVVIRNADDQVMTMPVASLAVAERELAQLHPRSVSA